MLYSLGKKTHSFKDGARRRNPEPWKLSVGVEVSHVNLYILSQGYRRGLCGVGMDGGLCWEPVRRPASRRGPGDPGFSP